MFFVIFDVEALFLYAWAVSVREAGWAGFIEAFIFIFILGASLVYLWKIGALDWGPAARSRPPRDRQTERSPAVERTTGSSRRSEEHTSELQSLMRISYAVFCLKKKKQQKRED